MTTQHNATQMSEHHGSKRRVYPQQQYQFGAGAAQSSPAPQSGQFIQPQQLYNVDATTAQFNGLSLGNVPYVDPRQQQQQQPLQQQPMTPAQQFSAPQGQTYGQPPKILNQLYPIDLLTQVPPPISDLSLPPPPLIVPPELTVNSNGVNGDSEYIRCTLNAVPKSHSVLKKSKLPLALVVRPYVGLKDEENPVPLNTDGVIARCRRCRSYINPFVSIIENGRRWRCNLCSLANDVPDGMDVDLVTRAPQDRYARNEFNHAIMEFTAPPEYMARPPPPSVYVFVIDASANSVANGLLATTARTILETLDTIPNFDNTTRVAFMCVDGSLSYFQIPSEEGAEPSLLAVSDLDEPFLPIPDGLLVNLTECRAGIEKLLTSLPELYQHNVSNSFALAPALRAAHHMIGNIGGKIVVFGATLPNIGVGKLQKRNEDAVAETNKEASALLSVGDSFYKTFTIDCNKSQVTIDLFLASSQYQDVATLSNLSRYTAGQLHFYPGWTAARVEDVTKFSKEVSKHLSMDLSLEAVLRPRCSSGIRMSSSFGHLFNRSSDLCAFSTFPRDQSYVLELSLEEQIIKDYVYAQVGILLSTNTCQRRIRVITVAIPTSDNLSDIYASADQLAIANYWTQKAIEKTLQSSLSDARDFLTKSIQDVLSTYKKDVVTANTGGATPLQLCANLRMLPLLVHSLTKHIGFREGKVPSDHRAAALNMLESLPLPELIRYIYPTVYSLHDMADEAGLPNEQGEIVLPQAINATTSLMERYGLYLINTNTELFLWCGGEAVPQLVEDVFGTNNIFGIPIGKSELPEVVGSAFNERIRNIISKVRESNDSIRYRNLYIVRGGSASEPLGQENAKDIASMRIWATSALVEDKIMKAANYREFLQVLKDKISK